MNASNLRGLLKRVGRLHLLSELGRHAGLALAALLAATVAAVALDAVVGLPAWGLITVEVPLALLVLAAAAYVVRGFLESRYHPRRLARLIEERLAIGDSRLINAVDFSEGTVFGGSSALMQQSVISGDALAASIRPSQALEQQGLRRAMLAAGAAAALTAGAYLLAPSMFGTVLARYADPWGDRPAFTLLHFDVRIEPQRILYGRPATIRAIISGPNLPDQASAVLISGDSRQHIPMVRLEDVAAAAASGRAQHEFLLSINRAQQSFEFFIETAAGRSGRFKFTVEPVPLFERVTVHYTYPLYTGWPETESRLAEQGIRALQGAEVAVSVKSNLPLRQGQMILTATSAVAPVTAVPATAPAGAAAPITSRTVVLQPDRTDPATTQGRFPLDFSGQYTLAIVGADGTPGLEQLSGTLTAVPDQLPQVQITSPDTTVVAVENWKVPVAIAAQDDVGIAAIRIYRAANGWGPYPEDLTLDKPGATLARSAYEFDLAAMGAKAGDIIKYFAEACDNFPGGMAAGHFTDTPTYVIQVISMEDYLELARTQYHIDNLIAEMDAFNARLDELSAQREKALSELEALQKKMEESGGKLTPEDQRRLEALAARLEEYADQAWKLSHDLRQRSEQPQLYDLEQPVMKELGKLAARVDRQAENASALRRAALAAAEVAPVGAAQKQNLDQTAERFRQDGRAFDKENQEQRALTDKDLARLRLADDMVAQVERIAWVVQQQRDVADRLGQFRNQEKLTPAEQFRALRLSQEQEQLRSELSEAVGALDKLSAQARDDLPKMAQSAQALCQAIKNLEVERDQSDAVRLAQAGVGRYAHTAADSAATKLESLVHDPCDGMEGDAAEDLDGCLGLKRPSLKECLQQMARSRGIPGSAGSKMGSRGSGYGGSQARVRVLGPHLSGGQPAEIGGTGHAPQGRGTGTGQANASNAAAEQLSPDAVAGRAGGGVSLPGVPAQYVDQAESYFKRLADENR